MAISTTIRKAGPFVGNGVTTVFPFGFKVFASSDLLVARMDAAGLRDTVLVLDTDYTVILNSNQDDDPGGSVTLLTALGSGLKLTVVTNVPSTQTLVLTSQGGFYPDVINRAFDKLTIIAQQILETLGRTVRLPVSSTADGTLPSPVANHLLAWNGTGSGLANVDQAGLATSIVASTYNVQNFTGDGTETEFVLTNAPGNAANILVAIGGVVQVAGTDFSLLGLKTILFTTAPYNGAAIHVRYNTGLAADNAVSAASAAAAAASAALADADAAQTALDRVATAADVVATADKVSLTALAASAGSTLVGIIAVGAGAVARTQQAKNAETITDADYTTLAQALTAATGKRLNLTQAWTVTAAAVVPANTEIVGVGGSITASGAGYNAVEAGGNGVKFTGIRVIGPGSFATPASTDVGNGIYAIGRYNVIVDSCMVSGFNNTGILIRDCFNYSATKNILFGNTYPTVGGNDSADVASYSTTAGGRGVIEGNFCLSNNSQGIYTNALGQDNDITVANNICVATDAGGAETAGGSLSRRHGIVLGYNQAVGGGRINCSGNVVRNTNSTGIYDASNTNLRRAISIVNNTISKVGLNTAIQGSLTGGITVLGGGVGTIIAFNTIYDFRGTGSTGSINISTGIANASGIIFGNTCDTSTSNGIILQDAATGWNVRSNILRSITARDIYESTATAGGHTIEDNDIVRSNAGFPAIYVVFGSGSRATYVRRNSITGFDKTTGGEENAGVFLEGSPGRVVAIEDNYISTVRFGIRPSSTIVGRLIDKIIIRSNRLQNCFYGVTCYEFTGVGVVPIIDCTFVSCDNDTSGAGGTNAGYIADVRHGRIILHDRTAAPTGGTWIAGDRAEFVSPAAGGVPGSICTTGGAPGTWKSYAAIAA